jgi:hypothetical protein
MHLVVGGVMLLLGVVATAVAAEAVYRGRVWHFRRGLLDRASGWVRRSREPFAFWLRVVTLAVSGGAGVGGGLYVLIYRPPLQGRR